MDLVWSLAYVAAWRVFLYVYRERHRPLPIAAALAILAGVLIAEWWAPALAAVNSTVALVGGPRKGPADDPEASTVDWVRNVGFLALLEAAAIACGVAVARLM